MPKVSIIIVNYNTKKLLRECIDSILSLTTNVSYEIIVVDNSSLDGSSEMVRQNFPSVILIDSNINVGFGRANNIAAKIAKGKYLFLLNSDARLLNDSLKIFYEFSENNNNIGVLGGKLVDENGKTSVSCGNFPSITQEISEYGFSKIFKSYYTKKLCPSIKMDDDKIREVDYIMGANLFISKHLFAQFGGFDEDFFLYYEETELCYRLNKNSYKNIWLPEVKILHHWGKSGKSDNKINIEIYRYMSKSKYLFYKKCYGKFQAKFMQLIQFPKLIKNNLRNSHLIEILKMNIKSY